MVRDGTEIYDTSIAQLKRFKDDAREVAEGFECGILLEGYNDLKEGDILEAYETRRRGRISTRSPQHPPPRQWPSRPTTSQTSSRSQETVHGREDAGAGDRL